MTTNSEETFTVSGEELLKKVRELIHEGGIRKISLKSKDGVPIIELPLAAGVVGAALFPPLAAVGVIAALVTECTITVEKYKKEDKED